MAFTRWDSLRDLLTLHEQLGHLVGADAPGWTPPVDLYETPHEFVLTAELPGLRRDQIQIQAEETRLIPRGPPPAPPHHELPGELFHGVERAQGLFSRPFALPEPINV